MYMVVVGFDIDVVIFFGNFIKLEMWVMLEEDEVVMDFYYDYFFKFENFLKLSEILF